MGGVGRLLGGDGPLYPRAQGGPQVPRGGIGVEGHGFRDEGELGEPGHA